jgi:hypothetical protein
MEYVWFSSKKIADIQDDYKCSLNFFLKSVLEIKATYTNESFST